MAGSIAVIDSRLERTSSQGESPSSGVSWGAVIGGAFVAAAFYLILLALGAGFGLSTISPWSTHGISASTAGAAAIVWLIFIEIIASSLGGYLAGRLRTKWALIHNDEVYFRDTANGFLAWAVALIISVTFLTSAGASMVGNAQVGPVAELGRPADAVAGSTAYFVDTLFRSTRGPESKDPWAQGEAERILVNALVQPQIPVADRNYLVSLISARTGIDESAAERRVSDVIAEARQREDVARKFTAHFLLWMFVALSLGAFSASYAATIGGRQRDHVKAV